MTFYEAALRVLESEGRPLHFTEITEKSIAQNLLSHVGKTPEQTMLSRLSAMARRTTDRRVIVTAKDTFALIDWQLPEDLDALALTGIPEPNPEEELPPLRPVERHPESRSEMARSSGRGTDRKRRRDEDEERGRKRRFPPVAEVVFEILSESDAPMSAAEICQRAREKELASDDLSSGKMLTALLEDNQRRIDAGRRPQFSYSKESGLVTIERAGAPSEAPPLELQAAFAAALGIPLEGGRPVLPRVAAAVSPDAQADLALVQTARTAAKDARRAMLRALRRRLADVEFGAFEKACVKMLQAHHFRELKVAKRSKEGLVITSRRKEGSLELRYAIRLLKGSTAVDRRLIQDARRDLGHHAAQIGLVLSTGELRGDARGEAQGGGGLVFLWCGEALAEKFVEAKTGVTLAPIELFEIDETFFDVMQVEAVESLRRREERKADRLGRQEEEGERPERPERAERSERSERRERRERGERPARAEAALPTSASLEGAPPSAAIAPSAGAEEEGEEEGGDEDLEAAESFVSGEGQPGQSGAPGERKRKRRRRRGRRGKNARPEGAEAAPGAEGAAPGAQVAAPAGFTDAEAGAEVAGAPAAGPGIAAIDAAGGPIAPREVEGESSTERLGGAVLAPETETSPAVTAASLTPELGAPSDFVTPRSEAPNVREAEKAAPPETAGEPPTGASGGS